MYERMLVPTDGSESADRAALHAGALAVGFDARVRLVNVVDIDAIMGPFDAGGITDEQRERLLSEGANVVEETRAALTAASDGEPPVLETAVIEGMPSATILSDVTDTGADLIVMGTRGRTGFSRLLAGSTTERVLRQAPVPVLAVQAVEATEGAEYQDVLIPTDGSVSAGVAVGHGLSIAAQTDATVHAVTVLDYRNVTDQSDPQTGEGPNGEFASPGEQATAEIVRQAEARGLSARSSVRQGEPAETLLAYVQEHDIELIAMGTHGRTGLQRVLLGSTTERLLRHASAPVLAVTPRGTAAANSSG